MNWKKLTNFVDIFTDLSAIFFKTEVIVTIQDAKQQKYCHFQFPEQRWLLVMYID